MDFIKGWRARQGGTSSDILVLIREFVISVEVERHLVWDTLKTTQAGTFVYILGAEYCLKRQQNERLCRIGPLVT